MDTPYGRLINEVMTPITLSDGRTLLKALEDHQRYLEGTFAGTRLNLANEDLSLLDFTGFNIDKGIFTSCNFTRSIINDDTCFGVLWKSCNLTRVMFLVDKLPRCRFNTCELGQASFLGDDLSGCCIFNSNMLDTEFAYAVTDALTIKVTAGATDSQKGLLAEWLAAKAPTALEVSGTPGDMV